MVSLFGTETSPSSADSSPTIIRNSVVLPAPLGPTRPTFSPGLSWKDASTKSTCRPYCLLTREKEIMRPPRAGSRGRFDGARERRDEIFRHERLLDVRVEAGAQRGSPILTGRVRRDRNHGERATLLGRHPPQLVDERIPVGAGQADVGDDGLRAFRVPVTQRAERLRDRRDGRDRP